MPLPHSTPISLSIHSQVGKANDEQKNKLGWGWKAFTGSMQDVFDIITVQGRAFSALVSGSHRCDAEFVSRQLFAIDIDHNMSVAELLQDEFYLTYGAGYYTTASHTEAENKFRVLFLLEEPITSAEDTKLLIRALMTEYKAADPQCKEATRIFFGVPNCPNKELTGRVLDTEAVKDLIRERVALDKSEKSHNVPGARDAKLSLFLAALESIPAEGRDRETWTRLSWGLMSAGATDAEIAKALHEKSTEETAKLRSGKFKGRPVTLATVKRYLDAQGVALNPIKFDSTGAIQELPDGEKLPKTIEGFEFLLKKLNVTARLNLFKMRSECNLPYSYDNSLISLRSSAQAMGAAWSVSDVRGFLELAAEKNKYNPLIDWLESVSWDGKDRYQDYLESVVSPSPIKEILMRRWAISAIAAVYKEGFHNEGVLVFQGKQAAKKTSWLESICPGFNRTGLSINPSSVDDLVKATTGTWISELGELDHTFRKADIARLKAFLTDKEDIYRLSYGYRNEVYGRKCVFMASVNDKEFLADSENRRFWVIPVDEITLIKEPQQLWAQIKTFYDAGEIWWLEEAERAALYECQREFMIVDPVTEWLSSRVATTGGVPERFNTTDLLYRVGFSPINRQNIVKTAAFLRSIGAVQRHKDKTYQVVIKV